MALVTGAAQGIGKCIARHLLVEGWSVLGMDADAAAAREASDELETEILPGDVSAEKDVKSAISRAVAQYGGLDGLVNNAGVSTFKPLEKCTLKDWQRVLSVNLTGPFLCTKHAAAHLKKRGGSIVNIASSRAVMSEAGTEAYSASKGGLVALSHASAVSLGPMVRVNCVSPGWIEVRKGASHSREDHLQHPVGRVGLPQDVAYLVSFLLSDKSAFITGAHYVIDGGMTRKMIYAE